MNYNPETKTGTIDKIKNSIVKIYEPPFDIDLMSDYHVEISFKVEDENVFNMTKELFPESAVGDGVMLEVFKAVNSVYPNGLSCADVKSLSDSVGQIALENFGKETFLYCGLVITGVCLKEIRLNEDSFASLGMAGAMLKSRLAVTSQSENWTCSFCSSVNNSKFCPNCGNPRN